MKRDPDAFSSSAEMPLDSSPTEPGGKEAIAIIGFAFKLPQDATSEENLWKLLMERRSTMTEVPSNRWNLDGFYKPQGNQPGTVNSRGGNFIADDPARFDAPFFSIPPAEAECMDPQQRFLLETSYQALENAGIPMEKAMGSRTSVHVGCLQQEYSKISQRDSDMPGTYQIVGSSGLSMLSNRLSWFYDFTGPSMTVDTACSGSLLAVHLACQDLLSGTVDMALACGSNLSLLPDSTSLLSALNLMSPDSTCYSFDERANGYSRSEGFGVILMKRLSRAISDGDTIRAVIRSTGCNQDGHTPGITQPSQAAQERLTRETYKKAGLDLNVTRYFEAHGTGTSLGDPTEACAISNAFTTRTTEDPLYIGALKSNIGHPESASGVAGIIKTILILESGIILPNKYPERINPIITSSCTNLRFPLAATPWPTEGVRRASVSSFGYGGTNVHVVLDDVLSYIESQKLHANHCTKREGRAKISAGGDDKVPSTQQLDTVDTTILPSGKPAYKLLVLSAFDERAVQRSTSLHEEWLRSRTVSGDVLADLAFTLASNRSSFSWKTFCVTSSESVDELSWSEPVRVKQDPRICFVFTGQGAQYCGMGRELYRYEAFRKSITEAEQYFKALGGEWSLSDELYNTAEEQSAIGRPELSQPICTAIQVAIVDLLSSWKVRVSTVVGHSSGEIAAAYASGAVSRESAWMLAYFRGLAVAIARDFVSSVGSMVAVLATPDSMAPLLETHNAAHPQDQAVVACYNSPSNLTISGSRDAIDRLKTALTDASITFRLLNVDVAYHSHHMDPIANIYKKLLRQIQPGEQYENQPRLVSTVTGKPLEDETVLTRAEYWMRNLIAPVQFSMALAPVCAGGARQSNAMAADLFIEIGPHSALRSPLKDMLKSNGRDVMTDYTPVLVRNRNAAITALECAGKLYLSGTSIDLAEVNQSHRPSVNLVTTLPPYPFNDKTKYWLEGRASAQYRFRNYVHHEFLGTRVDDWNEREARWTNRIILDQSPWLKDHRVNGSIIFPAAGFMVMTLEAARQFYGIRDSVVGYSMRDIIFPKAVEISQDPRGTELQLTLHTTNTSQRSSEPVRVWNQFSIFVYENAGWVECCSGSIAVEYEVEERQISEIDERKELLSASMRSLKNAYEECSDQIDSSDIYNAFEQAGLPYGPFFRALQDVKWNKCDQATGSINLQQWRSLHEAFTDPHLIHPTALDAILQLTFPAFSIYSKNASATTVPIGLRSAWFSSHITQDTPNLKAMIHAKVIERGFRNKSFSITAALADGDAPFFFGEMETSTIGTSNLSSDVENKPLYKIEYQPDIDLLPERTLYLKPSLTKDPSLVYDKELLCVASMRNALEQTSNVANLPMQLQNHVQWMEAQVKKKPVTSSESVESMCQRLEHIDTETRLLVRVARNLPSILAGEMDQPNLLFADNILSDFYSNFYSNNELLSRAAEEIRLLAYKYPAMKVLEIGAGTGSTTEHILGALGKEFTEYVYTDITPTSFVKAKERFASPKLTFKTLDISQDPIPQGYTEGSFDLIIAANVLHAANGLRNALIQCRSLLRPKGRIVVLKMTNPELLLEPYISGLVSGLSEETQPESAENNSQLLTQSEWSEMLRETGFSGFDTCISDAGSIIEDALSAIMISRVVAPPATSKTELRVIYDDTCMTQRELLQHLNERIASEGNVLIKPVPWNTILQQDFAQSHCLFLVDTDGAFLAKMEKDDLEKIKSVVSVAETLIWVTFHNSTKDQSPAGSLVPGLVRTLATENEDCRIVNVSLDIASAISQSVCNIIKVMDYCLQVRGVLEDEYLERDGSLHIPRVVLDHTMSTQVFSQEHTVTKPWCDLDNPHLTIGKVGRLNTLHFEQADPNATPLDVDEVLVDVRAVGLCTRDLLVAQGQVHEEAFGSGFAGVVSHIHPSAMDAFQIGDRVFGVAKDAVSQVVRCKPSHLQRVPTQMSFCEAATYPVAFCTAYYSLVHCARVKKEDFVLIHSAAGEVGQASIEIAQLYGCKVFLTLDLAEQTTFMHETYGIPRSHIFSSRTLDFSNGIRRLTEGRGVDVVVNSLVGEVARESWECLAPFGRFIDTGEIASATKLPVRKSRMFVSVDIRDLAQDYSFREVFGDVVRLIDSDKIRPRNPYQIFKQKDVESAFQLLQRGDYTGRIAIDMVSDEPVEMVLGSNSKPLFDPGHSYLLAGGFGGIGQSIARWMVQNGVKSLILPSRTQVEGSGSDREALVQELRAQGADIRAPICDIADRTQLERTLHELSDMPPIKGCIQAAMVLKDSSFVNMSIDDWHASLAPKMAGSWNLHQLLPSDLDFFVMFSSSTGIMGSFGQSNYTAGNTYQDALAAHRTRHGQHAHAIAMSMVVGVGWVAENAQVQALLRVRGMVEEVSLDDIYELLRFCCKPESADIGSQIITSLSLPADLRALGIVAPLGSTRPIYSLLDTLPSRYDMSTDGTNHQESKKLPSFALQDATSLAEAIDIITEAIQSQLSSLLVVSKDDIDPKKPIHRYGVDSLIGVEMRNWFAKGVGAEVATTEILGDAGIAELAATVASRSRFVKEELKI